MLKKIRNNFLIPLAIKKRKKSFSNLSLENTTLLSRNCLAGIVYHDLELQFKSPTINLYMTSEDYICFVENIKDFCSHDVKFSEVNDSEYSFPVAFLIAGNNRIKVYFMHYENFDDAKSKWLERSLRVNFDNIILLFEDCNNQSVNQIGILLNLPYDKIIFSKQDIHFNDTKYINNVINVSNIVKNKDSSVLFKYIHFGFSGYRWLDKTKYLNNFMEIFDRQSES